MRAIGQPDTLDDINVSWSEKLRRSVEPTLGYKPSLWKVEAAFLAPIFILVIILLVALIRCVISRTGSGSGPAEAAAPPEAAAPRAAQQEGEEAEDLSLEQKLSKLKKKKTQVLFHQAADKHKLQKIIEEILRLEASMKDEDTPDPEEVKRKADDAIQAADLAVNKNLTTGLAYVMPILLQSQRIFEVIDKRAQNARASALQLALDEVKGITKDMQEVFEVSDMQGHLFQSLANIDAPSLATIVGGAFAPGQLRLLYWSNVVSAIFVLLIVVTDLIVMLVDIGSTCHTHTFFTAVIGKNYDFKNIWYGVDLGVAAFCLLVRVWSIRDISSVLTEISNPPEVEVTDDPVNAMRQLLAYYLNTGTQAMLRLDAIENSYIYALVNLQIFFNIVWICLAGELILNTPWDECHNTGIVILRLRVVSFLLFLVPTLLSVVYYLIVNFLSGAGFHIQLLSAAHQADEGLGLGLPICSVLVQAFFVRNKRDMINIQFKLVQMKKDEADRAKAEAEKELAKLQSGEAHIQSEESKWKEKLQAVSSKNDQELLKEQEEQKKAIIEDASYVFGALNERAKIASMEAEQQVEKWEQGEGGELLTAIARGEGLSKAQEMAASLQLQAQQRAQKLASDLSESEFVRNAAASASETASTAQRLGEEALKSDQVQSALAAGKAAGASAAAAAEEAGKSSASAASTAAQASSNA